MIDPLFKINRLRNASNEIGMRRNLSVAILRSDKQRQDSSYFDSCVAAGKRCCARSERVLRKHATFSDIRCLTSTHMRFAFSFHSTHSLMSVVDNQTIITVESWFVPVNVFLFACDALACLAALGLLFVIIVDKTCHSVSMLLVANSCLLLSIFTSIRMAANWFAIENDLKQIEFQDWLCVCRAFVADGFCAALNYSFLLHSTYRYLTVLYPHRSLWRSARFQLLLIGITWTVSLLYPLEFLLSNEIIYNVDNQICQVPIRPSFSIVYMVLCIYLIPISLVILVYLRLVRHMKKISRRVIPANVLLRARRELKMVRRVVIMVTILIVLGFPYTVFIVMSYFTDLPKYHFRIALVSLDVASLLIVGAIFQFNKALKHSVMKRIKCRSAIIIPT